MLLKKLSSILADLGSSEPEVQASAVVSSTGLPIVSRGLNKGIDSDVFAGLTTAMLVKGDDASRIFQQSELEHVLVVGSHGFILIIEAGEKALLVVLTNYEVSQKLLEKAKDAAKEISKLIASMN